MAMRKRYFFHFTWIFHTTLLFWEMPPPPLSLFLSRVSDTCKEEILTAATSWICHNESYILNEGPSSFNSSSWVENQCRKSFLVEQPKTFLKFSPACECFNKTKQTKKIFLNILQIRSFNAFQSSLTHSLALALFLSKYIFSSSTSIFIWSP